MFDSTPGGGIQLLSPPVPSIPTPLAHRLSLGISTFARPDCCLRLVESIREYYPDVSVIVADDSTLEHRAQLTPLFKDLHLQLHWLPYDSGLSAKRNAVVRACST